MTYCLLSSRSLVRIQQGASIKARVFSESRTLFLLPSTPLSGALGGGVEGMGRRHDDRLNDSGVG